MDKRGDKKAESKTGGGSTSEKTGFIRHEGGCIKELPREAKGVRRTRDGTLSGGLPWNRENSTSIHTVLPDAHSSSGSLHSSVLLTCIRALREERVGDCVALRCFSRH